MIEEMNYDQVLEELTKFSQANQVDEYPDILDRYLEGVAKNGDIVFPWEKVKHFLKLKLIRVMDQFNERCQLADKDLRPPNCKPFDYEDTKRDIVKAFDWFNVEAPFTIQRLCELMIHPERHYRRTDKFLRGVEKNVLVVSTVTPRPSKYSPETEKKEQTLRDLYQSFHARHAYFNNAFTSRENVSGPGASIPNGNAEDGPIMDNGHSVAGGSSYQNDGTGYLNSSMSSMYDNHHSQQHLMGHGSALDPMGDSPIGHPQHHSTHHQQHPQSPHLAPLQQLDSFTNVFAASSSTSHHYSINGDGGRVNSDGIGGSGPMLASQSSANRWMSPELAGKDGGGVSSRFTSLLHNAVVGGQDNPDDENIVVDDDEDDDSDLDHTPEEEDEDDDDEESVESPSGKSLNLFTDPARSSLDPQSSLPSVNMVLVSATIAITGDIEGLVGAAVDKAATVGCSGEEKAKQSSTTTATVAATASASSVIKTGVTGPTDCSEDTLKAASNIESTTTSTPIPMEVNLSDDDGSLTLP